MYLSREGTMILSEGKGADGVAFGVSGGVGRGEYQVTGQRIFG